MITPIIVLYIFYQSGGVVLDFYIFWKSSLWRTPPSTRQLFYPLVNLSSTSHLPFHSHSYTYHPSIPPSLTLLLFNYLPSLISLPLSPTPHFPLNTYPQLIHSLLTSYPHLFHKLSTTPIDLSSSPVFPLLLLFLQSSPL